MYWMFRKILPKKIADPLIVIIYVLLLILIFILSPRDDVGFVYLKL